MAVKEKRNAEIADGAVGVEYLKQRFVYSSIAEAIGVTPGAMAQWGDTIPEKYLMQISEVTGVPPHIIRPDMYDGYEPVRREAC